MDCKDRNYIIKTGQMIKILESFGIQGFEGDGYLRTSHGPLEYENGPWTTNLRLPENESREIRDGLLTILCPESFDFYKALGICPVLCLKLKKIQSGGKITQI